MAHKTLGRGAAIAFAVLTPTAYAIPLWAGDAPGSAYIALHGALTLAMLAAWWGGAGSAWVLAAGIAARLLIVPLDPFVSNDVQRYLWDGAVALHGLDPYRLHPDHPLVAALRQVWPTPPEHTAYPTLYPPGALALFAVAALTGPAGGILLWKAMAGAAGIATVLLVAASLRRRGLERHLPLVALSPLLVLETGVGGHVDAISTLAVAAALRAWDGRRFTAVGVALGAGAAVKLLPLLALGPFALAAVGLARSRSDRPTGTAKWFHAWAPAIRMVAAAGGVLALCYGAALATGLQPIGSLPVFFEKWRNGAPIHIFLERVLPPPVLGIVLSGIALSLLALSAGLARRHLPTALALALAAPLAASPVVFPWYLSVLVPILAAGPGAALLGWVTLAPLGYEVVDAFAASGVWQPADWPLWATLGGVAAGLALDLVRWRGRNLAGQRRAAMSAS